MIVAISRSFGAGAGSVAKLVAERCGYRLISDDIAWRVARRLSLAYPIVAGGEELKRPFIARLTEQLPGAALDIGAQPDIEQAASLAETRHALEFEISDQAQQGDVVIVGQAASFVLGAREDLLRVFVHAPTEWRIARAAEWFDYAPLEAQHTVKRLDEARAAYVRDNYSATLWDLRNYDLTIDTSTTGFANAAEAIISIVAMRSNPL